MLQEVMINKSFVENNLTLQDLNFVHSLARRQNN